MLKRTEIRYKSLEEIDEEGIQAILNRYFDITLHDGKLVICGYHHQFSDNLKIKTAFEQIEHTSNELGALKLIHI